MDDSRKKTGMLASLAGIGFNLLLFGVKLPAGLMTGSVAITSDAFNNLSDMGSSVVGLLSASLAAKKPDKDHPYGYGRIEYLSSLVIAAMILAVAVELFRSSLDGILHPQAVSFSTITAILLAVSAGVKLFMYFFNRRIGKKIDSKVLTAAARDSLNDSIITASVLICSIIGQFTSLPIDGIAGIVISLIVLKSAVDIGRDTITVLLGTTPDPELVSGIRTRIESAPEILGTHDFVLHDYGPGRIMASAHAEVPADIDVVAAHEAIDAVEKAVYDELGVELVLHMDPIETDNEQLIRVREALENAVKTISAKVTFHDLRMTEGENRMNIIFDIVVPAGTRDETVNTWKKTLSETVKALDSRYTTVIQTDRSFV